MSKKINAEFYQKTLRPDRQQSYKLLAKWIKRLTYPEVTSVVDYGCGSGWLLHWLKSYGVPETVGVEPCKDAACVRNVTVDLGTATFKMNDAVVESIVTRSLKQRINLRRKFDLTLCIEVAEHIEEKYAATLIENITKHSDLLIFSAATPGQGGWGHVNEQPFEYWEEKLHAAGFNLNTVATNNFRDYLRTKKAKKWYVNNIAVFQRG
jgi:2-polyprenyl-3-methyl-5-hydroxy-6-metoxy-1,4-benzoquinol methylase